MDNKMVKYLYLYSDGNRWNFITVDNSKENKEKLGLEEN